MKIDKMLLKKIFVGMTVIILLVYISYLNREINSYEKESRVHETTIRDNSKLILELEKEVDTLREYYDATNKFEDELNDLIDFYEATNKVENIMNELQENNNYYTDNRKKIVDETLYEEGLWLIPQDQLIQSDEYDIVETRPYVYEYIDDSIFIYYFRSLSHLNEGQNHIEATFENHNILDIYQYIVGDSILVLYTPYDLTNTEFNDEQIEQLEKTLILIDEKME